MATSWEDPPEYRPESGGTAQIGLPTLTRGTRALLIANAAIFVASFLLYLVADEVWPGVVQWLGLRPAAWRDLAPFVPLWQLFTYGFLHSIQDPFHLLLNLLTLYFFGTMLEGILGTRRFLLAYFSAQLAGACFFLAAGLAGEGRAVAIGASGAVYGIMVAMATLRPRQRVFVFFIPVTLGVLALVFLGITLFSTALQWKSGSTDGVAHLVHLGGIVYGFLAVKSKLLFADPVSSMERSRKVREVRRHQDDEAKVDQLLDKINREGMTSLSKGEREFLKKISSRR
ncbi:MAG: rhomboid family intramembrane serine protease [Planctomycetota bacterium]